MSDIQLYGIFQNADVNVSRNCWEWILNSCDQVTFSMQFSKKIIITVTEAIVMHIPFLTVGSEQK